LGFSRSFSFTPGFSQVSRTQFLKGNRLNGFPHSRRRQSTWLKPGVNETRCNPLRQSPAAEKLPAVNLVQIHLIALLSAEGATLSRLSPQAVVTARFDVAEARRAGISSGSRLN
jgi:hypothetical protein